MKKKPKLIEAIIKATRSDGEKVLDKLSDYSETHLEKLLKVISVI
jgi:hypothetical protein